MRLHRLGVQAFGPFAERQEIDFDRLHEAGLFLLAGPTGAGKSSLLDAICFALYGQVPGVRDTRTLRSQHAPAGLAPLVELEVTLRGRRLRVRRTAEWERPKRRGEGTTLERSSVVLAEDRGGTETVVSTRAQEVGHEIGLLLGMTAAQFLQVAMLPQGEFQHFLHATSEERQTVLTRLFGTERFRAIEEWIADHSRDLSARAAQARDEAARRLHSLADRAGTEAPEESPDPAGTALAWRAWADDAVAACAGAAVAARATLDQAEAHLQHAREEVAAAAAWEAWWSRREGALARLAADDPDGPAVRAARARLAAHERARALVPLLDDHAATRAAASEAAAALAAVWPDAEPSVDEATLQRARREVDRARLRAHTLAEAGPTAEALGRAERALADATAREESSAGTLERARATARELDEGLARARDELAAVATLADEHDRAATAHREAEVAARAAARLAGLVERRHAAARDLQEAQEADLRALAEVREIVAARLDGMSGELAAHLEPDMPCPVCGGTTHPSPAAPPAHDDSGADLATRQESAQLRRERTAARVEEATRAHARVVEEHHRTEVAAGGRDTDEAAAALTEARTALTATTQARERLPALQARAATLTQEAERAAASLDTALETHAEATERVRDARAEVGVLREQLGAVVSPGLLEPGDLAAVLATSHGEAEAELARWEARLAAAQEARAADRAHHHVQLLLEGPLAEAGFGTVEQARGALLPDAERDREQATCEAADAARAEIAAVLAEAPPADHGDPGSGVAARARHAAALSGEQEAEQVRRAADRAVSETSARHTGVVELRARLHTALAAWEPVAGQHAEAESLARLVRGTGPDNHLQMRLSAYVLATRLDQVVDAANARLVRMRDQRYLMRRTDRVGSRRTRSGLDLEILDQWTGETRAPSTLSGGETFVLSLTLALGLADVVAHEAGGVELETLFVDEGFGMLDPDTLDDVLDRLDELRAGGRAVGVVSHVTEMQARIPTQIRVVKTRAGSHVQVGEPAR